MKTNSLLLSGIAIAALAGSVTFEAQAQTSSTPSPSQNAAAPNTNDMTPSGSTRTKRHVVHRRKRYMSSHKSTPAEKAATDQLNEQQLTAAQSGAQAGSMPMSPNSSTQANGGTASPAPNDQTATGSGTMTGDGNKGVSTAPNNNTVVPGSEPTMTAPQTGPQPVPNPNVPGNTPNQPSQTTPPPQ